MPSLVNQTYTLEAEVLQNLLSQIFLSMLPLIMISVTAFTKISIIMSLLRNAIGAQQILSSYLLSVLSLIICCNIMQPVAEEVYPFLDSEIKKKKINYENLFNIILHPIKNFMKKNTDKEINISISKSLNSSKENISPIVLSFMISEINKAFKIGFFITLPFLIIDIMTASILMSLGMVMLPPNTISLPIKIIFFVSTSGWELLIDALIKGYK